MSKERLRIVIAAMLTLALPARADVGSNESLTVKAHRVGPADTPVLDGKLDEKCWREAHKITFRPALDPTAQPIEAWIAYDDERVYVAFHCPLATGLETNRVEIFLDPFLDHLRDVGLENDPDQLFYNQAGPRIYHFAVDATSRQFSELMGIPWWKVPWRSATYVGENFWTAELEIPLASLSFFQPAIKTLVEPGWSAEWGVNFVCNGTAWLPGSNRDGFPQSFGKLVDVYASPEPYRWALLTGIGPKIVGDVPIVFTLENATGERRRVHVDAELVAPPAKQTGTAPKTLTLEMANNLWNHGSFNVPISSPGSHVVRLSITDTKSRRILGYRPLLINPVQVVSGVWDRSFYMDEPEAVLTLHRGQGLQGGDRTVRCDLRAKSGTEILQSKTAKWDRANKACVRFDLGALSVGDYTVTVIVPGYEKFPVVKVLRKLKARPGAVQYTDHGILLRDGKPFFPMGFYYVQKYLKDQFVREYAEAGFNTVVLDWMNVSGYVRMVNELKQYSIAPMVSLQNMAEAHVYDAAIDYTRKGMEGRFDAAREVVKMMVQQAGDNILAWYTRDEPNESMYELVRGLHEIAQEDDGYHPSITVIYTPHLFPAYHDATDILAPDIYPSFPGGRIGAVGDAVAKAVTDMRGKPVLAVVQTFYEEGYRMPTPAELRCMTYLSVVRGAKGILFFSYDYRVGPMAEKHPKTWEAVKELAVELRRLSPVILSSPQADGVWVASREDHVACAAYDYRGDLYVIAVNYENKLVKAARFSPSWGKRTGTPPTHAEVLFENRHVTVRDGVWEDDFDPYVVHVYRLEK